VAEEDFHRGNRKQLIDNKVNKDDETICTSNVPDPPDKMAAHDESIRHGPLIFNPSSPIAADEYVPFAAADDQAELMRWHYRLGHLSIQKPRQLALIGEIPKKLSKLKPPQVCWLSIWHNDQATLARQRVSIFSQNLHHRQAGQYSLS
jgi:hypothetical protein